VIIASIAALFAESSPPSTCWKRQAELDRAVVRKA
jgi:hypothetical protein